MRPYSLSLLLLAAGGTVAAAATVNVRSHGAAGDGETPDTEAIQTAIDACAAGGGGGVLFPKGRYLSGSLRLQSGVRLIVTPEATILGSTSVADFRHGPLILAQDAEDVGLEGGGTIDGQGAAFWEPSRTYQGPAWGGTAQAEYRALKRPSFLRFYRCRNVSIRDVRLVGSPSWTLHLLRCTNATVERVTIRNPLYGPNTDGIDINSCSDVLVRDCDIITGDDGIVLKSTEPGHDHPSRHIRVQGCRVWSACNCFKIGTETHDHFDTVTVENCHFYGHSEKALERPISGIAIESVDGAHLTNITVSDVTMDGVRAPIFVRLGHRGGNSQKTRQVEPRVPGRIDGVIIRNVTAKRALFESSITGIPGHRVSNIKLENIVLEYEGGGAAALVTDLVPDQEVIQRYPEAFMFGRLPAYGLYCRHVEGLRLEQVSVTWQAPDARPVLVCEDVRNLVLDNVNAAATTGQFPLMWFLHVNDVTVRNCVAPPGTGFFLAVEAAAHDATGLLLQQNNLTSARRPLQKLQPGGLLSAYLPVFEERAPGLVVFEADAMRLTPPMLLQDEPAVASGAVLGVPADGGRNQGMARCRFRVSVPGDYLIWVHVFAGSPEQDSFYASVNRGPVSLSDVARHGCWFWDKVRNRLGEVGGRTEESTFHLDAGVHSLLIRNRECNTRVDTIAIAHAELTYTPPPKGTAHMTGLLHNEDCTDFFYTQTFPPEQAAAIADRYVDVLAGAGVTVLFCNTNARRTNYRSDVWEAFWDGYEPDGPDDQPFLAPIAEKDRKHFRNLIHNMYEVHRQGVDYPAHIIQRCRHHGISPWISLRMNDVHCNDNLDHPFHGALWRKPEYFRQGHPGYYARGLDYAHPEVRSHYRALIAETLQRYDIDGLELDFMREPYLFSKGEEQAGGGILTSWLRDVHTLVDAAAARRGHAIKVGVRVPSDPGTALGLGLDAPTWAREGLVDLVVATPRWRTMHFDIPLREWRTLLGDRVTLAGGLETRCQPVPGGPVRAMDPECAVGAAVAVLSGGADVVYLFNHFQNGRWPRAEYQSRLKAFASLAELCTLPRRHVVTQREIVVPGAEYQPPLPAKGNALSFALPLGPAPPVDWLAEAIINVEGQTTETPTVSVNGVACALLRTEALDGGTSALTYAIAANALTGANSDMISIATAAPNPITVTGVEVRFAPPEGR